MTLGIVAIAWMYVVLMMALAEALSPQGTVLGAIVTLLLYGVAPLALVLYLMGTPMRRQRQREREGTQETAAAGAASPGDVAASAAAAAADTPSAQAHSPEGRTQAQDASQTAAAIRPVTPSRRNE
jgi:membrane protein implicated in regulation of membrane protease activity